MEEQEARTISGLTVEAEYGAIAQATVIILIETFPF